MAPKCCCSFAIAVLLFNFELFAPSEAACDSKSLAIYDVQLETFWSRKEFPKHYPEWRPPASWSKTLGFSHDNSYEVFRKGEQSTSALKLFAEKADCSLFDVHSQGYGGIFDSFSIPPIGTGVGSGKSIMFASGNHTKISAVTKIVPSPDWFIGIDSYDLCPKGRWLNFVNLELGPLDAGTDKGLTFTSPNWPTETPEKIQPITAHFPSHPAGSFYYPTIDELPVLAHFTISKLREYDLKDSFDAADFINIVPEDKKEIYRYDIATKENQFSTKDVNKFQDAINNPLTNEINLIPKEPRRPKPYHRRFGPPKPPYNNALKYNKYQHRKKHYERFRPSRPPPFAVPDSKKNSRNKAPVAPKTPVAKPPPPPPPPPPTANPPPVSNATRRFPHRIRNSVMRERKGRKKIPSGDVMAVIDDIVKDYQKEHRRKIKKRRREERRRRREQMKKFRPPRDCRVSEWLPWSPCSKTCGIGEQTRARKILKNPRRGGKPCPVLEETTWCGSARACPRDYFKWQ